MLDRGYANVGGTMLVVRKEEMMDTLVLYDSQYGNTERQHRTYRPDHR